MSKEKWIIIIENDNGDCAPHGWWKTGEKTIHQYEYETKEAAFKEALSLSKYVGSCKVVKREVEEGDAK